MAIMSFITFGLCKKFDTTVIVRTGMIIAIVGQIVGIVAPTSLGALIGSGVTTLILGASGYDGAAAAQVASALSTIKGVYLYLPLAFAVVIFVIMCFYKLNSKNYNHIVSELEQGRYHPNAKYASHSEA